MYHKRFRYYAPEEGMYVSQDPIGLAGGMVAYGYVRDVNSGVDVWGLSSFVPKPINEGNIFRGVTPGQPAFSPSAADLAHFNQTGEMAGISTKPVLNSQAKKFFAGKGATVYEIDVAKLPSFNVIRDGKEHSSVTPKGPQSQAEMSKLLKEWSDNGDNHPLSKELKNAATHCP